MSEFGVGGVICHDCGNKYGRYPEGHLCSSYIVDCPYCGETKEGTEQRDYGYPEPPAVSGTSAAPKGEIR